MQIPWSDLVECLTVDATSISLPVGDCKKIHLVDRKTEIKVEGRNFIHDNQICTDKDCKTTGEFVY
jgi:hypothetical protein